MRPYYRNLEGWAGTTELNEVDRLVRSKFTVKDTYQLPDGEVEYKVDYGPVSKLAFVQLKEALLAIGMLPHLTGSKEECVLQVKKKSDSTSSASRVPVILALLTLTSVIAFSLLERIIYQQFAPSISGEAVILMYGSGVVALLGAHEIGHMYFGRSSAAARTTPYFLPGIPDVTAFLPALGIVSKQKEPALNRDSFFDVILVGPVLGFSVAVLLYLVGAFVAAPSTVPLQGNQLVNSFISVDQINPSVIQILLDRVLDPFAHNVSSGFVSLSPLQDAATVGFLLTFVGLLPMASFDGGHLSSLAWGLRASRLATYVSVFGLIALDTPNYWALAIVVLLVAGRPTEPQLLDEVSDLTPARRWLYLGALILALASLPIPQSIATFPLS